MGGSSNSSCFFKRVLFGALAIVMFICVLVVGSSGEGIARRATTAAAGNIKHGDVIQGRVKLQGAHLDQLDHLNYTSKRRVPNGPDPIHNRRSGNSRRPPGTQA